MGEKEYKTILDKEIQKSKKRGNDYSWRYRAKVVNKILKFWKQVKESGILQEVKDRREYIKPFENKML